MWPFRKHPPAPGPPGITKDVVEIGGRRFAPVGAITTIERDDWLMGQVQNAGLDMVFMNEGEGSEEFGRRILAAAQNSNMANELLGAFIVPEGTAPTDWTPHMALETGGFLRKLTDPEDKKVRNNLLVTMLIGFFENGLSSLRKSASSSPDAEDSPAIQSLGGGTPLAHGAL